MLEHINKQEIADHLEALEALLSAAWEGITCFLIPKSDLQP